MSTRLLRAQWDGLAASQSTASVDEIIAGDLAVDLTLFFCAHDMGFMHEFSII